jgi:hypothetical protein
MNPIGMVLFLVAHLFGYAVAEPPIPRDWPGVPYTAVRAYAYNHNGVLERPILAQGKLDESVVNKDGALLSRAQIKRLLAAVTGSHKPYELAMCFEPRHAFVFYQRAKPVAVIEVCFACRQIRKRPTGEEYPVDLPALSELIRELKVPLDP